MNIADLFCGAGGTSEGACEAAIACGRSPKLTAINHWDVAVATHTANHPNARHYCASLDALNPRDLFKDGELDLLWASPECTHHSQARGGKPINDQSRATAWCVTRWAEALRPATILVENVPEFQTWGPIGSDGRPLASRKGEVFRAWVATLEALGYTVGWRVLRSADYGDPTTRERMFVQAVRGRRGVVWPNPTHRKSGEADLFDTRKQWVGAREIIDWSLPGSSIFDRKRPLSPKTLARIESGLRKYGLKAFTCSAGGPECPARPVDEPLGTVLCRDHRAIVEPHLLPQNQGGALRPVSEPAPTVATAGAIALIEPFLVSYYGTGQALSVSAPLDTVTTRDRFGLCRPVVTIAGERYQLDVRFRMLQPHELAGAQGFLPGYKFTGTKTEQVKQIGNAVTRRLARAIVTASIRQDPDVRFLERSEAEIPAA